MNLSTYRSLDDKLIKEIDDFLILGETLLNPLYSSPLWALRLKKIIKFNYIFLVLRQNNQVRAVQLVFQGYRGYQKIDKLPSYIRLFARFFARIFFGYHMWFDSTVFLNNESNQNKKIIKKIIYAELVKFQNLRESPVWGEDQVFFPKKKSLSWGTFLIHIPENSYEAVFSKFNANTRRQIRNIKLKGCYVRELNSDNLEEYSKWLKVNQGVTGKSNRIDVELIKYDLDIFNKANYIYKVFIAYNDGRMLGSLSIWGFGDYVVEHGVYRSKSAKDNQYNEQDLLKDWAIRFALENNVTIFDLGGFNPNNNISKKEEGIKNYKKKFGGDEILYNNVSS